jgi:hypothetical protein
VLSSALEVDGFADDPSLTAGYVAAYAVLLPALRGEVESLRMDFPSLDAMRASEDGQDQAGISAVTAAVALARGDRGDALRHARAASAHVISVGWLNDWIVFAWPLAIRLALEVNDRIAAEEQLRTLEGMPVGHVPPLLRATCRFARARLSFDDGDPQAVPALATAVDEIRAFGSPYHLAQALLDYADVLRDVDPASVDAGVLIEEARAIGMTLRVQPLVDRANGLGVTVGPT